MNKRILAISSVVLGLAIVGYGVYVFQKPIEISSDAQTISKLVKYPEYENTLENRPFFMALGIEADTDENAVELGKLRYHRNWQLLVQNTTEASELDNTPEIQKLLNNAKVFTEDDKAFIQTWQQAANDGQQDEFLKNHQKEMQSILAKYSTQINRYGNVYSDDYLELPLSVFGILTTPEHSREMHILLLAKIWLSPEQPQPKMQQYQRYLAQLRHVQTVSDFTLISQMSNLGKMNNVIQAMNDLAVASKMQGIKIEPLDAQEMSMENGLAGEILMQNRDTGSMIQEDMRKKIPKNLFLNQTTANVLPAIELSKLPYPQFIPALAKGIHSKPYAIPLRYKLYENVLTMGPKTEDYVKYAISPRVVDYNIHLFNAIQSGQSLEALNAQQTYGEFYEENQQWCLRMPKEFTSRIKQKELCLKRPVN